MTRIAVTGGNGHLGKELVRRGCIPVMGDIRNENDIYSEISRVKPDVLIHCAAITSVDYCENNFKESFDVNVRGTGNVIAAMPKNSLFVYISTDHVFAGENWFNQGYGEWHRPNPVNRYGYSKWGGELVSTTGVCNSVVVRSSKCFNYEWAKPTLDKLRNGESVVFTDLIKRSFVHFRHFADSLLHMVNHYYEYDDLKVVNIAGNGVFSYFQFWQIAQEVLGLSGEVISSREKLEDVSPRPFRAGLDVKYAKRLEIPIYDVIDGIKLLQEEI
jgi:dTDP-4-dehydrorhamnose reductase